MFCSSAPARRCTREWSSSENAKTDDIEVNVCKTKHLTNTRSSSADEAPSLNAAQDLKPGAGPGLYRHRRASGSNAQEPAASQEDPGSPDAQAGSALLTHHLSQGGAYETIRIHFSEAPCRPSGILYRHHAGHRDSSAFRWRMASSLGNIPNLAVWPNYDDLLETCFNLIIGVELIAHDVLPHPQHGV